MSLEVVVMVAQFSSLLRFVGLSQGESHSRTPGRRTLLKVTFDMRRWRVSFASLRLCFVVML